MNTLLGWCNWGIILTTEEKVGQFVEYFAGMVQLGNYFNYGRKSRSVNLRVYWDGATGNYFNSRRRFSQIMAWKGNRGYNLIGDGGVNREISSQDMKTYYDHL